MGQALFYHLLGESPEGLVQSLTAKARSAGWRVELRGTSFEAMSRMDDLMWQNDGFLPHGRAGGPHDARQPVLLTLAGEGAANRPACLITLDGAAVAPEECAVMERVCIVFDGNDAAAVDHAREQWRQLKGAGVAAEYWAREDGRWQRKAG